MSAVLAVRNESKIKRLCRTDALRRVVERVLAGEDICEDVEVSVLFCDDTFIQELNRTYRCKDCPTDVLSFAQEAKPHRGMRVLGDIVISLETVASRCRKNGPRKPAEVRDAMRAEVRLLLCHGLLHLLGYQHGTERTRKRMAEKQALYLDLCQEAAWPSGPAA